MNKQKQNSMMRRTKERRMDKDSGRVVTESEQCRCLLWNKPHLPTRYRNAETV